MKYQMLFLIVLMLVHPSCSSEHSDQARQQVAAGPTLSLGMSHASALEIIRECGGRDITSNLALMGPNGEQPPSGLYWSFEQYDSVIEIGAEEGKVVVIDFWTGADFSESKEHQARSRKSLKSLTFEKQSKTVKTQVL